jgi:hypothetical protein
MTDNIDGRMLSYLELYEDIEHTALYIMRHSSEHLTDEEFINIIEQVAKTHSMELSWSEIETFLANLRSVR